MTLAVGDLDGDGRPDAVTGGMHISRPSDRLGRITAWLSESMSRRCRDRDCCAACGGGRGRARHHAPGGARRWCARDTAHRAAPGCRRRPPATCAADSTPRRREPLGRDVGPLCLAYHADMFFDQAERCYDLVIELEPGRLAVGLLPRDHPGGARRRRAAGHDCCAVAGAGAAATVRHGCGWATPSSRPAATTRPTTAWQHAAEHGGPAAGLRRRRRHVIEVPLSRLRRCSGLARVALRAGRRRTVRVDLLERLTAEAPGFSSALRLLADAYRALGREADAGARRRPRQPAAAVCAVRRSDGRRPGAGVAQQHAAAAAGIRSQPRGQRGVERVSDPARARVRPRQSRGRRSSSGASCGRSGATRRRSAYFERYHRMVPGDYQGWRTSASCFSALGRFGEAEGYLPPGAGGRGRSGDALQPRAAAGPSPAATMEGIARIREGARARPDACDARGNLATALARRRPTDRARASWRGCRARSRQRAGQDQPTARAASDRAAGAAARGAAERGACASIPRLAPAAEALRPTLVR